METILLVLELGGPSSVDAGCSERGFFHEVRTRAGSQQERSVFCHGLCENGLDCRLEGFLVIGDVAIRPLQ